MMTYNRQRRAQTFSAYSDLRRALSNNNFYSDKSGEYNGVFYYAHSSHNVNHLFEYWEQILDDELGPGWYKDYDMYLGDNPDPASNYVFPYAMLIEPV
jgi:hypothetical protein